MIHTILTGLSLGLLLLLGGCKAGNSQLHSDHIIRPTHIEALANDNFHTPPGENAGWYPVSLPDNWSVSRPGQGGGVWYRVAVDLPAAATDEMGVVLANFSMNATIWWDEHQIESGGRMIKPYTRNWHRPLYATVGLQQLSAGRHWLHIRVHGYANDDAGIGTLLIGPAAEVRPVYERIYFIQHTMSVVALVFSLLLALGALLMWVLQRGQSDVFLLMAGAAAAWSLVISNFVIYTPLMSRFYWESIADGAIEVYGLLHAVMVFRILEVDRTLLIRSLAVVFASGWLFILLFGDDATLMGWQMPMHSLILLLVVYLIVLCFRYWCEQQNRTALVLAVALLIQIIAGGHDWWLVYFSNQLDSPLTMQLGPTFTLLVVGIWMIHRFSLALHESAAHAELMQAEIERVSASLKAEQAQMAALQKERAIAVERERFSRELHDGLGGYLAAISGMLHDGIQDQQLLTRTVDQALLDMRLVMDGIGEECNDVGMLLGMLRHRLQQPLEALGLHVSWNMTSLPAPCPLPDGQALHLMRIVQEALTNAARHAGADWVEVRATQLMHDRNRACIEVIDNGCGLGEASAAGKGLANMRRRAEMLQAQFTINSPADGGVHITLILPPSDHASADL